MQLVASDIIVPKESIIEITPLTREDIDYMVSAANRLRYNYLDKNVIITYRSGNRVIGRASRIYTNTVELNPYITNGFNPEVYDGEIPKTVSLDSSISIEATDKKLEDLLKKL